MGASNNIYCRTWKKNDRYAIKLRTTGDKSTKDNYLTKKQMFYRSHRTSSQGYWGENSWLHSNIQILQSKDCRVYLASVQQWVLRKKGQLLIWLTQKQIDSNLVAVYLSGCPRLALRREWWWECRTGFLAFLLQILVTLESIYKKWYSLETENTTTCNFDANV